MCLIQGCWSIVNALFGPFVNALFTRRKGPTNHEVTIDDTGLHLNGPLSNFETGSEAPWSWISQVYENDRIFLLRYSWGENFILPKRGFPSEETVEQFRILVREQTPFGLKTVA
jgi:hypothetical protein